MFDFAQIVLIKFLFKSKFSKKCVTYIESPAKQILEIEKHTHRLKKNYKKLTYRHKNATRAFFARKTFLL